VFLWVGLGCLWLRSLNLFGRRERGGSSARGSALFILVQ